MRNVLIVFTAASSLVTAARADCTSEVTDAFAKLRMSAAFRMETTITNPQGTLTMSNDYVLPDRMHQTVSMSGGGAPGTMQMILIGGKAWSNQGDQGWAEVPDSFASTIAKQMKETVVEPPKDESQFECLGDVTFEGKTYAAYRSKRPAGKADGGATPPTEPANVQTVYIDKSAGIPARNIVTPESDPNKRLFDGTFSLRAGITIEPPKL